MRFTGGLLVSLLFAMGLSACTYSDGEWTRNRGPSREAAARTDDKEAECRDPYVLDFDAEDSAGNRAEQKVFALELNEESENDEEVKNDEEGSASEKCQRPLDIEEWTSRYGWTSITDVQNIFDAIAEEKPDILFTENVSNHLTISLGGGNYDVDVGPQPLNEAISLKQPALPEEFVDLPAILMYESGKAEEHRTRRILQPRSALVPSDEGLGFYRDQHLMVYGVCDPVAEEATVFVFDPNFVDEEHEYHKVWSEGSAVTQRSLPVPRFRFPLKTADAIKGPMSIGIKVVDASSKSIEHAALIEVFVKQGHMVHQELVPIGEPREYWLPGGEFYQKTKLVTKFRYRCTFELKITRTYEKQLAEGKFAAEMLKLREIVPTSDLEPQNYVQPTYVSNAGLLFNFGCHPKGELSRVQVQPIPHFNQSGIDSAFAFATNAGASTWKWYGSDGAWESSYAPPTLQSSLPADPSKITEFLATISNHDGDPYAHHYYWVQTDLHLDPTTNDLVCDHKINGLSLLHLDKQQLQEFYGANSPIYSQFFKK
tara:strand:- start:3025 stop:4647 length:1623 start_codon:yes stop_codon:yes gene_type:complete